MTGRKEYIEAHRGAVDMKMPGLTPVVFSALEARNIAPQVSQLLTVGPLWMLLYVHTPARLKLHGKGMPWNRLDAGTAILLGVGARYYVDTFPAKGPSWHTWAAMDGLEGTPMLSLLPDPTKHVIIHDPSGVLARQMGGLIDAIEANKASPFWATQVHGRVVMDVLACAVREKDGLYCIGKNALKRKPDPFVGRAVTYMEAHIGERITLADIAKYLHAGPSTVSHRFRAFTGESPMQILKRMRLIRAKVMLTQGHRVADIAHALGYYDEHHFSLAFKKSEGHSPRKFANQSR